MQALTFGILCGSVFFFGRWFGLISWMITLYTLQKHLVVLKGLLRREVLTLSDSISWREDLLFETRRFRIIV